MATRRIAFLLREKKHAPKKDLAINHFLINGALCGLCGASRSSGAHCKSFGLFLPELGPHLDAALFLCLIALALSRAGWRSWRTVSRSTFRIDRNVPPQPAVSGRASRRPFAWRGAAFQRRTPDEASSSHRGVDH